MFNIIQFFFVPFMAALFFVFFIRTYKYLNRSVVSYFFFSTIVTVLLAISDAGQGYLESFSYPTIGRMLFASTSYTLRVGILYSMLLLFIRKESKKTKIIVSIPFFINALVSYSALLFKSVFYYTDSNELVRGPLISIPFICSALYFCLMVYFGIKNVKKGKKAEIVILSFIFVFATMTTIMEAVFRFQGVLSSFAMLGIIFYYMFFLSYNYTLDQLTGAYVRNRLYKFLDGFNKPFAIITFDANGLKKINDKKGHIEGDKCLVTLVDQATRIMPINGDIYRLGGDEFAIVLKENNIEAIEQYIKELRAMISTTPYTASIGYTIKMPDEDFEAALNRADEMMYKDKNDFYAKNDIAYTSKQHFENFSKDSRDTLS